MMRLPNPSHWTRRSVLAAAVAGALTVPMVTVPHANAGLAEVHLPVLWEGNVVEAGKPASAEVVAFLRPPVDALVPAVPLVPLARTVTDSFGRYILRAVPTPQIVGATDPGGWVTVMVAAFTDRGMTLAVDSLAWQPAKGGVGLAGTDGRWVTSPAALAAHRADARDALSAERPEVLTVVPFKAGRPASEDNAAHAPKGAGSCWLKSSETLGRSLVAVGELHLNRNWGGLFSYTNTRSSSFEIGVSHERGPWQAGGSVSMSKNKKSGQEVPVPASPDERFRTWKANMLFKRFEWGCNKGYPDVHEAATLEPVEWTGGLPSVPGGQAPTCRPGHEEAVDPGGKFIREEGQSVTLGGAISFNGFSGSVTSAYSKDVRNEWINGAGHVRSLCGENSYISRDTRVYSFA